MSEKYLSNISQSQNVKYQRQKTARSNHKTPIAPASKSMNQSHGAQKKGRIPKQEPQESDWIGCEDDTDFNAGWISMAKK